MNIQFKPVYCPALRLKAGELEGVRQLAPDVADCILPRFILPPKEERGQTAPRLFEIDAMPDVGAALSVHWRGRPALVDTTHIMEEYGRERLTMWLPAMFERAWKGHVRAIPVVALSDLGSVDASAFRSSVATHERVKFAICVSSDEMVGPTFHAALTTALERIGLTPDDCAVLADFGSAEFGDPTIVAPIISGALETLQEFGPWQQIIFQGTHYPEVNPAKDGTVEIWPRNEWLAWKQAVHFDPSTAEYMIFGDYAADCSKIKFGGSGGAAIRHIRYATAIAWLIYRAVKSGSDLHRMRDVYKKICESGEFAGENFSAADAFIARAAIDLGVGPGNSTTWRQINTTHHITQVVSDIAKVRGIVIKRAPAGEFNTQMSLLGMDAPLQRQ